MLAVECREVHRQFGDVQALDGVNLAIEKHQIFGLLGPNGSGKTTLLNQLQGLDRPTSGVVRVLGLDPVADRRALVARFGAQLQESKIIPRLKVREALNTFASFYPKTRDVDELLLELGLTAKAEGRLERLSSGQRQRVFIAMAMLHDPELLFFDELTSAVDPQARLAIWDVLRGLRAEGRTIILTTHSMEEAQSLCDGVAIIDRGRIVAQGTPAELIERHTPGSSLWLRLGGEVPNGVLQSVEGVTSVEREGEFVVVRGSSGFAPGVMARLLEQGVSVQEMKTDESGLEDVFLALTGRRMREGE